MSTENITPQEWKPKINPWIMIIPLMSAAFMFMLDETIANVALPHMAGSFSISREESMWILTSYLIASGIIIPSVDFFCKLMGRKNFFMASVLLFTFSSFLCGISTSMELMILSRILQGLGGGALMPIAQAIMLENFAPEDRAKSMGVFGLVVVMAPVIGPALGGWITDNWSWPFIYFINVPIGVMSIVLAKKLLEDPPYAKKQKNVKIDKFGFIFLIGWLVCLQTFLDKGNNADWFNTDWVCWLFALSIIFMCLFIYSQLKNKEPLCDLKVFLDRNFLLGTAMQVVMQAILLASLAVLPQFLQIMLGYDAFLSGLSMMPRGIGSLIGIFLYSMLAKIFGEKFFVTLGLCLLGLGSWMLGFLNLQISQLNIIIPNIVCGIGLSMAILPIITLSCATLPNSQMTNASGLQNLLKNIGGAIGTSLVATVISRFGQVHQHYLVGNLHQLNPNFAGRVYAYGSAFMKHADAITANYMAKNILYKQLLQQSNLSAFIDTFRIFAVASVIIIPLLLFIKNVKRDGDGGTPMMH